MKRPLSFLAILALGSAMLQAAPQLYDITLSNAEKFTQCKIAFETDSTIKFTGTNKKGEVVTKEVKTSSVLFKKEVKAKVQKTTAPEAPADEPTTTEATPEETPATTEEKPAEETPAETPAAEDTPAEEAPETAEETTEEAPAPSLNGPSAREKSVDAINTRLAAIDKKKSTIESPSRNLNSRYSSSLKTIEKNVQKLEKDCAEIDAAQAEYDALNAKPYQYEILSERDRAKYAIDGKAAYDAMVMDMNQKKNSRKIGGLDKFEELRESFQGISEYPEAYSWYLKTLKELDKKWEKSITNIEKKRKKLNESKRAETEAKEQAEYEKLEEQLEEDGEHIAQVWYTPRPNNLLMLKNCKRKVEEVLRRSKNNKPLEHTGKVMNLINNFWASTDKAKDLMLAGNLDEAKEEMDNNEDFKIISKLHKTLLPDEYKKPIQQQRSDLYDEIKDRVNKRRNLQRALDSKRAALNRLTESTDRQVDKLEEIVDMELDKLKADAAEVTEETAEEEQSEE
ncbi:MAG: hypothetical protein IKV92_03685 [Akkermansia sp.]|nr:hypothetical protein [Akkermansia sp.]